MLTVHFQSHIAALTIMWELEKMFEENYNINSKIFFFQCFILRQKI